MADHAAVREVLDESSDALSGRGSGIDLRPDGSTVAHRGRRLSARRGPEIDEGHFTTEVSTLAVNAAAIGHLADASRAQGIGTHVPDPINALIDRRVADGHAAHGLASLIELIKQSSL